MNDTDDVTSKLAELLRHPDDLDKIISLKSEFTRKKTAVDSQLRVGLQEQLTITQSGMSAITDGQHTVNMIKEEMMKIDRLCVEAQNMIRDFPFVDKVARMHANFTAVEEMMDSIVGFGGKLDDLEDLLREDDQDMENQNNLLAIHYGLTQLRDIRDKAMDQIKTNEDSSLELINNLQLESGATLQDLFSRLDEVIDWFDEHVGTACMNLIPLVQSGNNAMVVRLALIVEEEEKKDRQVKALQDAQREFKDLASRFKQMNSMGQKELRGYKEKFLEAIKLNAQAQFDTSADTFLEDPDKLEKSVRWYFNDLNTVKLGMQTLMPKKWRIFKTYINIYHTLMHDFLVSRVEDPNLNPPHMLAIVHWISKYYTKMEKLGIPQTDLHPHVIDDRESDLVREYRNLITRAVDQWMDRIANTDKQSFIDRKENSLDIDAEGHFRTKTLGDMWRMFKEQLLVASSSERPDVVEGVVDAMINTLKLRQEMWRSLAESEVRKFTQPHPVNGQSVDITQDSIAQSIQSLQDWLVALANDQIACIDDNEDDGQTSYLTLFRRDYTPLVTPAYALSTAAPETDMLSDNYVDLGTHCISLFVSLIFVDFRPVLADFFTPSWYGKKGMAQVIATFEDYLADYTHVLHPSLRDVLVEELADELLVKYLSAIRNKNVKFRRGDAFVEKIKDDVVTAFEFFSRYEASFPTIKDKFRAVNSMVSLLSSDKGTDYTDIKLAYEQFKQENWDLQISFVEAVLRTRDDFDRGMLNAVKGKAAQISASADFTEREERMGLSGGGGGDTVMGKVR